MLLLIVINCAVLLFIEQSVFATANEAIPLDTLTVTIINGNEEITLNWQRTGQYLANHNLPVWFAWKDQEPALIPNGIVDLGQFVMYHDVDKCSAVVYSVRLKCLFGIIDTRFYIDGLPLNEVGPNEYHHVNGFYVKSRGLDQSHMFHDDPPKSPQFYNIAALDKASIDSFIDALPDFDIHNIDPHSIPRAELYNKNRKQHVKLHQHQPEKNIFYAEILVFIDNNIVRLYNANEHNLMSIVLYYLVNFNAIDMLYAKLIQDGIVIHINIAGLVLEAEANVFPYVFATGQTQPNHIIDGALTTHQMINYIYKYKNVFSEDSFDFFHLSTGHMIHDGTKNLSGISTYKVNVYENRKYGYYHPYGTLVQYITNHGDYIVSAHEIAHIFDVNHDSRTDGCFVKGVQCHAILQEVGCFCRNCLKWSEATRRQFQIYVSTNLNRCYLLNSPRSLHQYGNPIQTIGPEQQCKCYGYRAHVGPKYYLDSVDWNDCNRNLACIGHRQTNDPFIPKPIDGTPCDLNKVCWKSECHVLTTPIQRKASESSKYRSCHKISDRIVDKKN